MKILFYNYAMNMGGIERTIATLSSEFAKEHEVVILQYTNDEAFYPLDEAVRLEKFGFSPTGNVLVRTLKLYYSIRKFLKAEKPDVVFCMNKTHLPLFCIATRQSESVVIGVERSNPNLKLTFRQKLQRRMSVMADGFVFQTERARSAYPLKIRKNSIVIPNSISNPDVFLPFDGEKKKAFVSVGRLEKVKGYDLLIQAFSLISDKVPEWTLTLFGHGDEREALQKQAESFHIADKVEFAGEDLHAFLKARECEVFVLSSRSEGMPNSLLEAMAAGLACVAFDCQNGPRELITHGENGLLVSAENVDELAAGMLLLAQNDEMRQKLAIQAQNIRFGHSPEQTALSWSRYANECLIKKRG